MFKNYCFKNICTFINIFEKYTVYIMETTPKINLPVPYKQSEKVSKSLKKIDNKLKALKKTGTEKILSFVGSNEVEAMFYLYLFKKYKSNCFLHDKSLGIRILGMSILISETYEPKEIKENQDQLDNLSKILVGCITNLNTKIIIVPVQLRFSDGGHANVLIYRKNLNQIEHFEPHGRKYSRNEDNVDNKIIEKWIKLFVLKINARLQLIKQPSVKLIESSEVCPYIDGLQNMEGWSTLTKIAGVEPMGYCVAWSMFFTELCLKNPDIPSSTLINYIFNTLQSMGNIEKRNYLKSVIRGYATFVNEKIDKYFSVFLKSGLTIERLKNLPRPELNKLMFIIRYLVDIEMNLTTDTLFLTNSLKRIQNKLTSLNESLKLNSSNDAVKREIELLTNKKNIFEMYDKFNVVSNPTESLSYASSRSKLCPQGKEINPKTGRCVKVKTKTQKIKKEKIPKVKTPKVKTPKVKTPKVKTPKQKAEIKLEPVLEPVKQALKSCPEGKELNLKTGRCVKTKIQKVKKVKIPKVKTPKVKTPKQKAEIKLAPVLEQILQPEIKMTKSCPEGKEINIKTGRCVKTKTQKVKKVRIPKMKTSKVTIPKVVIKLEPPPPLEPEPKIVEPVKFDPEIKMTKSCPPGKKINPKTGRCIKVKTQKVKKAKISKKKMEKLEQRPKTCPEGKEINPKTGRCVKTKTQKVRKIKMKL